MNNLSTKTIPTLYGILSETGTNNLYNEISLYIYLFDEKQIKYIQLVIE